MDGSQKEVGNFLNLLKKEGDGKKKKKKRGGNGGFQAWRKLRSQKFLQGLVSQELTAYVSIFNLFKPNELSPYYQKHVN